MAGKLGVKLRRAREGLQLTQEELSREVGLSSEFISLLEVGKRAPSLDSLSKIATYLKKDMSYFLEDKEDPFQVLMREKNLTPSAKAHIRGFKKFCNDYLKLEEITGRRLDPAPVYHHASPVRMAQEERQRLGLGEEPIRDIFALAEINGLRILREPLSDKAKIAGIFVFFEADLAAFAMVDSSSPLGRQTLAAAHLYGHFLRDRDDGPILDNPDIFVEEYLPLYHPREKNAQEFAFHFLIPRNKLEQIIKRITPLKTLGFEDIVYIKRYFGIDTLTMLQALLQWQLLPLPRYHEFLQIDSSAFEKSLFGDVVGEARGTGKGKTATSDRYKVMGVTAYRKKPLED